VRGLIGLERDELVGRLGRMPMLVETMRMKRAVDEIQREVGRVEDGIEMLGREFLYVSIDGKE
jgi:hypothetical protein